MGFYTYAKNNTTHASVKDEFISWLNEHGVTCTLDGTTLSITDFNGMSGTFTLGAFSQTSAYHFLFTLVTTPGKEIIVIHNKNRSSYDNLSNVYISALIFNRGGVLYASSAWQNFTTITNAKMLQFGNIPGINFNSTGDNYIVPLMLYDGGVKVLDNYFISINFVDVAPGVVISDGTKQFISCGLFLFVEYDPATMSE